MKKYAVYTGFLVIGLVLGYFIFGIQNTKDAEQTHEHIAMASDTMWTCSMHPHIKQSESGDCPICGMDLIAAETAAVGLSMHQFRMTENALALANVQTSIVGGSALDSEGLKLSGTIKENEEANAVQVTHFSGRIEKLLVNSIGEKITRGQTIAIIYSPELVAAQQELLTSLSLKKRQPELYKAVRNKLKLRKLSDAQIDQIESSGVIKETFPLHAHVSGIVSEKMIEEGNHIERGGILFKIANLNTVWASFDAYENQISLLKKGQKINIKTNAYPNKNFKATISFIDPILNTSTRTVHVRAVLNNNDGIFKPGMFIEGIVSDVKTRSNNAISIPKTAVLWTGERSVVYIKTQADQMVFEMREVVLGDAKGDLYSIIKGLEKGEEVVTNGTFTVDAAAQLQGKKSMMNRDADFSKDDRIVFSEFFQKYFISILPTYFLLKDALVTDNATNAFLLSKQLLEAVKKIDTTQLQKPELARIQKLTERLQAMIKKENISNQRDHFVSLNEDLGMIVKQLDYVSDTIYIQKCPMADNDKGAIWLSREKEIKNPYFGDKMLTCGSVIDVVENSK